MKNLTLRQSLIVTVITFILIAVMVSLGGCSIQAKGTAYWPKENQDNAYLSRQAENGWAYGSLR